ncbi:PH domain-containing protein [Nocardioides zeae]|uniref:PH domain-containing protein n=1 Tax=Nocardioides zeae TaxID=1457234 RepID=A0A6P0HPC0_9ACTN|nr:PH domain-containing protein [Nocardioides zeae]NEN80549.1 PH domain-containing protein [Nocardioides zeae]
MTSGETVQPVPVALREPAHQVSPRAVTYWRVGAGITASVVTVPLVVVALVWPDRPWWYLVPAALVVLLLLGWTAIMPSFRYRVHRWELTDDAVHTRSGWLSIDERIAPLSRVQTVDSSQGPLQRAFGLRSLTVTTASAAGPITIACLDVGTAQHLVADLTAITGASQDDAT